MTAGLAERAVLGVQTPRLSWMPEGDWDYSLADQCVEWARVTLKVCLDDWQILLLRMMLARRPDGTWACRQYGLVCSRQSGKSFVLVIRCLFGLIVLGEREVVYSAHHGDTIRGVYAMAETLLTDPSTMKLRAGIPPHQSYSSAGREALEFEDGRSIRFRTRTKSGGRGLTGTVLVMDEAQELTADQASALGPILASKSMTGNPQVLFAGSAGDFESAVFARIRLQGMSGTAKRLGFAEWSIDDEAYFAADAAERDRIVRSPEAMAQANPTFGLVRPDGTGGISTDYLMDELDFLGLVGQAREHFGVGTWPKGDAHDWSISRAAWMAQARPTETVPTKMVLALSASWGDRSVAVAAAGGLDDGTCYGWLERLDRGTSWAVPDVLRLVTDYDVAAVLYATGGPAASLAVDLTNALKPSGVELVGLTGRDEAAAFAGLSDAVTSDEPTFAHRGQAEVDGALAGSARKDLGSGLWVFDRRKSETDIAPLEALAFARHGWAVYGSDARSTYEERGMLTL